MSTEVSTKWGEIYVEKAFGHKGYFVLRLGRNRPRNEGYQDSDQY